MRAKFRQSKLLKRYLFYYLVCALVPVLILALVYFYNAQRGVIREYELAHEYTLSQTVDSVDRRLNELRTIAAQMSNDQALTPYQARSTETGRIEAINKMRTYHQRTDFLENLLLYFHGDDTVYSNVGVVSVDVMTGYRYAFEGDWDSEDFRALLAGAAPFGTSPYRCYLQDIRQTGVGKLMLVTYPLPATSANPYATIVGMVNDRFFIDIMEQSRSDIISRTFILDAERRPLYTSGGETEASAELLALLAESAPGTMAQVDIDGQRHTIITRTSGVNQWVYVTLLPHSQFTTRFVSLQLPLFITALLLLAVGIAISVLLALKSYRPIRDLEGLLRTESGADGEDELRRISAAARKLLRDNENLQTMVDESQETVIFRNLRRILTGIAQDKEYEALQPFWGKGAQYYVSVVALPTPLTPEERRDTASGVYLFVSDDSYAIDLTYNNYLAIIRAVPRRYGNQRQYAKKLSQLVESLTGYKPRIGIGEPCENPRELHLSYDKAMTALETYQSASADSIVLYSEMQTLEQEGNFWYPSQAQLRLTQMLWQGSELGVAHSIHELRDTLQAQSQPGGAMQVRFMTSSVTLQLLPVLEELSPASFDKDIFGLVYYNTLDEYFDRLSAVCERVLRALNQKKAEERTVMYEDILAYIDAHCFEQTFGLNSLAAHFNLSPSYASRFFRDRANRNFIDYITQRRMDRACALLAAGEDIKIRDIVEQVGYVDAASFTRKFTQHVGMSPSAYRGAHRPA